MTDPAINAAIMEVVLADEERADQAMHLALCEMVPDIPQYLSDDAKDYARWWKEVKRKADEIFSRLN